MFKKLTLTLSAVCLITSIVLYKHNRSCTQQEHVCSQKSTYASLWEAVMKGTYQEVEQLLAQGASVTEYESESALHAASQKGDVRIAALLLQHGADVHAKSYESGWTPLHQAASEGHIAIAQLLLEHNADINEKSKPISSEVYAIDEPALHVAARAGHLPMVQFLVEHGADINQLRTVPDVSTALHEAVEGDNLAVLAYLFEHGATAQDIPGIEPLLVTACHNETLDILQLLIERGYDINAQDKDGLTPLMMAIQYSHEDQVRYLLDQKADTTLEDKEGYTALAYADEQELNIF